MSLEGLRASQAAAHDALAAASSAGLDTATPCKDWNLAQLIDHLVGTQAWMLTVAKQDTAEGVGAAASGGDFVATFDELATMVAAAFAEPGFADRKLDLPFGTFTGAQFIELASLETLVHAWDVARAVGQPTDLAPSTSQQLLEVARAGVDASMRGEHGNFGPELEAPSGATDADRLAAFLGRDAS